MPIAVFIPILKRERAMGYYSENASSYIAATINTDMSDSYAFFLPCLKEGASILDVGFGSARDMLYFKKHGYKVKGIDLEAAFVEHALSLGLEAEQADILSYETSTRFDGIWACASLVHLHAEELDAAITRLLSLLSPDGLLYISMKLGEGETIDEKGRVMLFANEGTFEKYHPLKIARTLEKGRVTTWINVILPSK